MSFLGWHMLLHDRLSQHSQVLSSHAHTPASLSHEPEHCHTRTIYNLMIKKVLGIAEGRMVSPRLVYSPPTMCLVLGPLWHLGNGGFLYREQEGTDLFRGNVRHLLTTNWCLECSQMSRGKERGFSASPGCPCLCGWAKNSSRSLHSAPRQLLPARQGPLYSLLHFFSNSETFCSQFFTDKSHQTHELLTLMHLGVIQVSCEQLWW